MEINWSVVAIIAAPIIALFIGAALDRLTERKPKVSYYLGHASAFQVGSPQRIQLHTHSLVIVNYGKKPATGVRIVHDIIPENFNVYPRREHEKIDLPDGGAEIRFSNLVPREQVTISYLYFPPITWSQFNTIVRHDGGFGKAINVLPTPQYPKWILRILRFFVFLGIISFIYFAYEFLSRLIKVVFLSG